MTRDMCDADTPHSIWLRLAAQTENQLQPMIDRLAFHNGQPGFVPHITLVGDLSGSVAETQRLCDQAFAGMAPIPASVQTHARSEAYFMALFLPVDLPKAVSRLRDQIAGPQSPPFVPHISLAYGDAPDIPADLCPKINALHGQTVMIDRVAIVKSAQSIAIADWSVLAEIPLGGP